MMSAKDIICDNLFAVEKETGESFELLSRAEKIEAVYDNLTEDEVGFIFAEAMAMANIDFMDALNDFHHNDDYIHNVVCDEIGKFLDGDTPSYFSF